MFRRCRDVAVSRCRPPPAALVSGQMVQALWPLGLLVMCEAWAGAVLGQGSSGGPCVVCVVYGACGDVARG